MARMKKEPIRKSFWEQLKEELPEEQFKALDDLFDKYYTYMYTYELDYPKGFDEKEKADWKKFDFYEAIQQEALSIKVRDGY